MICRAKNLRNDKFILFVNDAIDLYASLFAAVLNKILLGA